MQSYQELKSLTRKELLKELADARRQLMEYKITVKTKHHKDSSSVSKQKRHIARLSTALKAMEMEDGKKETSQAK